MGIGMLTATLRTMNKLNHVLGKAVLAAVAVLAGLVFLKRPVKHPKPDGAWHPAEHEPSNR